MVATTTGGRRADLIVVGGGLAGLSAAAMAAGAGQSVVLLEKASGLGGRAATHERDGVRFNLGPHALYCHGHAFRLLRRLGVPFSGKVPSPGRAWFLGSRDGFDLTSLRSVATTRLLTAGEKWRLVRFLAFLGTIDARGLDRVCLRDWVAETAGSGGLAALIRSLVRVSTYVEDPDQLSAGAALGQLQLARAGNVWYLDGGWQTLVDGLRDLAVRRGAEVRNRVPARSVFVDNGHVVVATADGATLRGTSAILAVGPKDAVELLGTPEDAPLARWVERRRPVRAACLDVALSRLPRPESRFALGLDEPFYFSVHSAAAQLAPSGIAVIHVMKYLNPDTPETSPGEETELEAVLDRVQPGWRDLVVHRRFLPRMVAANAVPRADEGGTAGRPGVAASGIPNVFLAGDWVGAEGFLADAAAASAEEATRRVLEVLGRGESPTSRGLAHAGR